VHDNVAADSSWVPQLHLTEEELEVVEAKGMVLLLGRSGTENDLYMQPNGSGSTETFMQCGVFPDVCGSITTIESVCG